MFRILVAVEKFPFFLMAKLKTGYIGNYRHFRVFCVITTRFIQNDLVLPSSALAKFT